MNKFTSSIIKRTLQQGNKLIRSSTISDEQAGRLSRENSASKSTHSHRPRKNSHCSSTVEKPSQSSSEQESFNAYELFIELKAYTAKNQQQRCNIINILIYAERVWNRLIQEGSGKTGQSYAKCLEKFKIIEKRLNREMSHLIVDDGMSSVSNVKAKLKRIIDHLSLKARKYVDKNEHISNIILKKEKQQLESESQEEAIKQEMIELLDSLKGQALNIGRGLKEDNILINKIDTKQDKQISSLSKKSEALQQIINSQRIGFFKLISMAGIGIALWIFTILFILMF